MTTSSPPFLWPSPLCYSTRLMTCPCDWSLDLPLMQFHVSPAPCALSSCALGDYDNRSNRHQSRARDSAASKKIRWERKFLQPWSLPRAFLLHDTTERSLYPSTCHTLDITYPMDDSNSRLIEFVKRRLHREVQLACSHCQWNTSNKWHQQTKTKQECDTWAQSID